MWQKLLMVAAALAVVSMCAVPGEATTLTDNFSVAHNYSDGAASGIWSGVWNVSQLGAGTLNATGGALSLANAGVNYGWEGGRSNAPMLYLTLPPGAADNPTRTLGGLDYDFQATLKITAQTQGNWSNIALIARPVAADPPSGTAGGTNGDENFITAASFNITAGTGGTHRAQKRIESGVQQDDFTGNWVGFTPVPTFPVWIRLVRRQDNGVNNNGVGANPALKRYHFLASPDGTNWFQQSTSIAIAGNPLNVGNLALDVGLSFHTYGTLVGTGTVDDFVLDYAGTPSQPCGTTGSNTCTWNVNSAGDWNSAGNWAGTATPATSIAPNGNTTIAVFAGAFTGGAGTLATVFTNSNVTVKELRFNNATSKYVLAGAGQITLDADSGNALITVQAGSHEIQVPISLAKDVTANASNGTTLNINSKVSLNGHSFNTAGAGTINLNNNVIASGSGNGSVVNGSSLEGLAGVEGDLTQTDSGSLGVVVGSSPISVTGSAVLDGVLDVSVADGFKPVNGQTYTVLTADSVTNAGLSLEGASAGLFRLSVGDGSVSLTAVPEPAGLALLFVAGLCEMTGVFGRRRR